MQIQLKLGDAAEKIGAQQDAPGLPRGKDNQRQSDPADTGGHAFGPLRHTDQGNIGPAHPRAGTAEQDRKRTDAFDLVAQCMCRIVVFPHGAQDQTGAGEFQSRPDAQHDQQADIDHGIVAEQDAAQHRNIAKRAKVQIRHPRRFHPHIALTHQRRQAQPEQCHPKAGRHLIGQRHLREEDEQQ